MQCTFRRYGHLPRAKSTSFSLVLHLLSVAYSPVKLLSSHWKLPHHQVCGDRLPTGHLLEKKRYSGVAALIPDRPRPIGIHWTGVRTRLAADDDPILSPALPVLKCFKKYRWSELRATKRVQLFYDRITRNIGGRNGSVLRTTSSGTSSLSGLSKVPT